MRSNAGSRCDESRRQAYAVPRSCSRCCSQRSPRRSRRRCSPISSAGAARSSIAATRCRRRRSRWPACSGAADPRRRRAAFDDRSPARSRGRSRLPPIPLDNGEIRGAIVDAQSRLNINALGDGSASAELERRRIARCSRSAAVPSPRSTRSPTGSTRTRSSAMGAPKMRSTRAQPVPGLAGNAPVVRVAELADGEGCLGVDARRRHAVPVRVARRHAAQRQYGSARGAGRRSSTGSTVKASQRSIAARAKAVQYDCRVSDAAAARRDAWRARAARSEERLLLRHDRSPARRDARSGARAPARSGNAWPTSSGRSSSKRVGRPGSNASLRAEIGSIGRVNYLDHGTLANPGMTTLRVRLAAPPRPDRKRRGRCSMPAAIACAPVPISRTDGRQRNASKR